MASRSKPSAIAVPRRSSVETTAVGSSSTGTRPRCRSRQTSRSSRCSTPTTAMSNGSSASRSCMAWPSDPTRLSTTPPIRTRGSKRGEPVHHRRHRPRHRAGVDHQHHGRVEQPGDIGRRRCRAVGGSVEQPHHALDDEHVGARAGARGQGDRGVDSTDPGIEVPWWPVAGEGVVAGVDEVRPDLGRGDTVSRAAQRDEQPRGHGGLADARVRAGDDEAGSEQGHGGNAGRYWSPRPRSAPSGTVGPAIMGSRCESGAVLATVMEE